jgi:hypothetical protein
MSNESQIRNRILREIQRMPSAKLFELQKFVEKLKKHTNVKSRILSFAGAWNNIEESVLKDLTENLTSNRKKNSRRFNE